MDAGPLTAAHCGYIRKFVPRTRKTHVGRRGVYRVSWSVNQLIFFFAGGLCFWMAGQIARVVASEWFAVVVGIVGNHALPSPIPQVACVL